MANHLIPSALKQISENLYEIDQNFRTDMRVPARVFTNQQLLKHVIADKSLWQLINVATLPGIQRFALAMPDIHEGYGFPIGGVAAMDINDGGVISPGGIGYDINCGVRLLATDKSIDDVLPHLSAIAAQIFHAVPSGVGRAGFLKLKDRDLRRVLEDGAHYLVKEGVGEQSDLEHCESSGRLDDASADVVSDHAKDRGKDQLGTLGSGNHFLELQKVDEIFDSSVAQTFGLAKNQVTAMIHCGSRGLGHQVCTDHVRIMLNAQKKYGFNLVDRQLSCAPFLSQEGQDYFAAMKASANFAWANRHTIGQKIREAFQASFGKRCSVRTVYDVAHNIGKLENHDVDGRYKKLIVHRKGATRAFGPNDSEVPSQYRATGQPVLIPGTMGTASYVLAGTADAMSLSFGSACHGAGRAMSRHAAKKLKSGPEVRQQLLERGITVWCDSNRGLAEEAPYAYKDIDEVINVVVGARLARLVARLKPITVIKGD